MRDFAGLPHEKEIIEPEEPMMEDGDFDEFLDDGTDGSDDEVKPQ